ncbi:tripartite tricarboxylate transporter TctB family protein [Treponema sp. OMZ 840]|uniref:tripartite tricarboxylate transporter TctB family protein n=1 Tax=Treponema sp. OMZ 840 TaxID=244313 RepID=UPI003D90E370
MAKGFKFGIKHMNNFVLSIFTFAIGSYITFAPGVVTNMSSKQEGGFFARPDVYLKMLSVSLMLLALILAFKSIGKINDSKENTDNKFHFYLNREIVYATIALILYAFLLPIVGFAITTTVLVFYLVFLFATPSLRDIQDTVLKKREIKKLLIMDFAYTVILVVLMYLLFTYLFGISLP